MAIKTEQTTLQNREGEDVSVETTTFVGSLGVELFSKVFLIVMPIALPILNQTGDKSVMSKDIDLDKVAGSLSTRMNEKEILRTIMNILGSTTIDGQEIGKKSNFDLVFAGEYMLLFKVLKFVLEVNFGDFFGENGIGAYMELIPTNLKKAE